jgi:hypothetical protein
MIPGGVFEEEPAVVLPGWRVQLSALRLFAVYTSFDKVMTEI